MPQEPFIFHRHLRDSAARSVYCLRALSAGLASRGPLRDMKPILAGEHEPYSAD